MKLCLFIMGVKVLILYGKMGWNYLSLDFGFLISTLLNSNDCLSNRTFLLKSASKLLISVPGLLYTAPCYNTYLTKHTIMLLNSTLNGLIMMSISQYYAYINAC